MSTNPEIRINFAFLLFYRESKLLAGKHKLHTFEEYETWTKQYKEEWRKSENKILTALQEVLGIQFYKRVIDVYCAPGFVPKSEPLIMNFRSEPDEFVDTLTHELCHVLLTDNSSVQLNSDKKQPINIVKAWQKLYGKNHDFNTLVHIPVHALLKYVYLDIWKEPKRYERDIAFSNKFKEDHIYATAWKFVDNHNYKEMLAELRKMYAGVSS